MHPWERDARLMRDAVIDGSKSYNVVVEIACTRSSEELLGARRAYHSIFDRSIEEDVAYNADGVERKVRCLFVFRIFVFASINCFRIGTAKSIRYKAQRRVVSCIFMSHPI